MTPYAFAIFWIFSGAIAWRIATRRGGSSALWTLLGQVFGPISIPMALLVRGQAS